MAENTKDTSIDHEEKQIARYDPNFDKVFSEQLCDFVQAACGCFSCEKQGATKKCSACKVAVYCDRTCQRSDWREEHKEHCQVYCGNQKQGECMAVCLRSCGYIGEVTFMRAIKKRRDLLLSMISSLPSNPWLHIQSSVIGILGSIRIVALVSVWDDNGRGLYGEPREVRHIMIDTVDEETPQAMNRLYRGSGTISPEARAKAFDKLVELVAHVKQYELTIGSITFGRGMVDFADDANLDSLLKRNGFKFASTEVSDDYQFDLEAVWNETMSSLGK